MRSHVEYNRYALKRTVSQRGVSFTDDRTITALRLTKQDQAKHGQSTKIELRASLEDAVKAVFGIAAEVAHVLEMDAANAAPIKQRKLSKPSLHRQYVSYGLESSATAASSRAA
jgi:hypothetical protein